MPMKMQARPTTSWPATDFLSLAAALGLLVADAAEEDAELDEDPVVDPGDEAVLETDDEGDEVGTEASVELPTIPTPKARVDAPSNAHCSPPKRWSRNRSSCHAAESDQVV